MDNETTNRAPSRAPTCYAWELRPRFLPRQHVRHILDDGSHGVITAFMIRGANHSFEVQWDLSKCTWHLDFELEPIAQEGTREIGFATALPSPATRTPIVTGFHDPQKMPTAHDDVGSAESGKQRNGQFGSAGGGILSHNH